METMKRGSEGGNDSDSQTENAYLASMSDLQFRESLDALLDGEGLNSDNNGGSTKSKHSASAVASRSEESATNAFSAGESSTRQREQPLPVQTTSAGSTGFSLPPVTKDSGSFSLSQHFAAARSSARLGSMGGGSVASSTTETTNAKRGFDAISAVSEDEGERVRRRQDRNMREQQRSHQITHQIANLKSLLRSANIQFKPDKYSTLTTVVEYIQSLQSRSEMLDSEHKKLLDTITKTTEIVNNQYIPSNTNEPIGNDLLAEGGSSPPQDESMVCVQGLDYKAVFDNFHFASSVATIDGRFVEVNKDFEEICGYTRAELLPLTAQLQGESDPEKKRVTQNMSLFNVLKRSDMEKVFIAMSEMLKAPMLDRNAPTTDNWMGEVEMCRVKEMARLTVNLVRTPQGRPRFFTCLLVKGSTR